MYWMTSVLLEFIELDHIGFECCRRVFCPLGSRRFLGFVRLEGSTGPEGVADGENLGFGRPVPGFYLLLEDINDILF